ncbi:MAG: hypothetical protein WC010_02755 [Candidatus Absconditabacterales bacterium]
MTDPIQGTNPTQQGQQGYTDDILGGENIFATIPEATTEDDDLPYGDVLEKKYQFDPIPEVAPVQAQSVKLTPAPVQAQPVSAPVVQPVVKPTPGAVAEDVAKKEIQEIEQESSTQQSQVGELLDTKLQTDVQKKFGELFFTTKNIYLLKEKIGTGGEETFDILGANNDKIFISYRFLLDETNEPILFITKIEQDKETEEETSNELRFTFNEETSSLEVTINDILLFDEIKDFTADQKKKMQVVDKLNKFTFLASEEVRKLEKEIKEREAAEQERRKLQEIFRNF